MLGPLDATAMPSTREGNSLSLCCIDDAKYLVAFGGRVLRDLTSVLPEGAVVDPVRLSRARHIFSNAAYYFSLESKRWELKNCRGTPPRPRSDHTAVVVTQNVVVIAGGRGRNCQLFRDWFVLDTTMWNWNELDTRDPPCKRFGHGSCIDGTQLFVFGGQSDLQTLDSLHILKLSRILNGEEDNDALKDMRPIRWSSPRTVSRPPSARFGMTIITLDDNRIAVVGGWQVQDQRKRKSARLSRVPHLLNVFILDTITMVWTQPRLALHICALRAPSERLGFDCFFAIGTLIVFGGFTYAIQGANEEYTPRDDGYIIYTLDVRHMIWRRDKVTDAAAMLAAHMHTTDNAILCTEDDHLQAFYCGGMPGNAQLQLGVVRMSLHTDI